MRLHV
jgi:hypothetical protein